MHTFLILGYKCLQMKHTFLIKAQNYINSFCAVLEIVKTKSLRMTYLNFI